MTSSATEHRFGSTPPYTIGVEEEYMLLDPVTFDLVNRVELFLAAEDGGEFQHNVSCELFESEIEVHTSVCADLAALESQLRLLRGHIAERAEALGVCVGSAGTHPFALFEDQHVTERPRYQDVIAAIQYPAFRELIFGLHVHVGVPSPEAAITALNGLRLHLAELAALSASSPFWRGKPTGLASTRHVVFATFPRSGIPPRFADYEEFEGAVGAMEAAGYVADYTRLWWDVRPHPRLGTIEIRVLDAAPRIDDALALAAYVQALVKWTIEEGGPGDLHDTLVQEAKWQAVRHGLDAHVATPGGVLPVREAVAHTLERIAPHAAELGGAAHLAGVERILAGGTSAERQVAVFEAVASTRAVTASIAAESAGAPVAHARVPSEG
jgi:carboxylate-amine ligase